MRKLTVIVAISVISLLNVATRPTNCYYYYNNHNSNDASVPVASARLSSDGKALMETTDTRRELAADNQLIESLDNVEFENILTNNKNQLTKADYQPSACQLVQIVHLLQHPGCQSKAIASFACSGSCTSFVRVSVFTDLCPCAYCMDLSGGLYQTSCTCVPHFAYRTRTP